METALKINPSLCVSSPPAWAQPFTVREKAFVHQARAYFPVSVQLDELEMPATRPLERQVFVENLRTAHLNFWKQCHPVCPDLPEVLAVIKKILRCNWIHPKPKDPEKRAGGFKTVQHSSRDGAFALQQRAQEGPAGCKKTMHTYRSFFNCIRLKTRCF